MIIDKDQQSEQRQSLPIAQVIEIEEGEQIVVPDAFQQALGLGQGGTLTLIQFDGLVLLTPRRLESIEALDQIGAELEKAGVTLENLLAGLDSVREQIYQERYGGLSTNSAPVS